MIFRKSPDVIARREGDYTLVFHQRKGWIFILNPTSTFIWDSIAPNSSPEEIADEVLHVFTIPNTVDPRELHGIVESHLMLMHRAELLDIVEECTRSGVDPTVCSA